MADTQKRQLLWQYQLGDFVYFTLVKTAFKAWLIICYA